MELPLVLVVRWWLWWLWGFFCGECADVVVVVVVEPTTEGVEVWPCACSVACMVPDSRVPETKKAVLLG